MSIEEEPPPATLDRLNADSLSRMSLAQIEALVVGLPADEHRLWVLLEQDHRIGVRRFAVRQRRRQSRQEAESLRLQRLLVLEQGLWAQGLSRVAGVDEVGRGCLAGPVVAAAVLLPPGLTIPGLDDSKKLTPERRERLLVAIEKGAQAIAMGQVEADEIDRTDILQASLKAMRLALAGLAAPPEHVLVDGAHRPGSTWPETAVPNGDARSLSIAAASVVAKVRRDRMMVEFDRQYPQYGFARHKGYGTAEHVAALREYGPCALHRRTFAPVQQVCGHGLSSPFRLFAEAVESSRTEGELEVAAGCIRERKAALQPAEIEELRHRYQRRRRDLTDGGHKAENLAAEYLISRGYAVLERRYRGAGGEIDLVVRQEECVVFVEVKSTWGRSLGWPEERVGPAKQARLVRAAHRYLQGHGRGMGCRFDVIAVEAGPAGPLITHLENAFQAPVSR